ncbi:MAG: hypothetical protein JW955_07470 [Sedimentisphaerales bacterium]|nr:hypothetical protein [Sedimentisphaerales bacterium]
MSGVEKWIEQWRGDLADTEALGNPDVRELESHLREEMEHLKAVPLSDEEASLVARHRLGDTAALKREFSKVNVHRSFLQRLTWGIMGVLLYFAALALANAVSVLPVRLMIMGGLLRSNSHFVNYLGTLMAGVRHTAFLGTILLALWLHARHLQRRDYHPGRWTAAPTYAASVLAIGTVVFVAVRIVATHVVWGGIMIKPDYRYAEVEFQIAAPVLLAAFLIVLSRRSRREAQIQP